MRMFKCNDCGLEFFQPRAVEESRGEFWGIPCSETMYYCPGCESEDFEEIEVDDGTEVAEYTEDDYYDTLIDDMMAEGVVIYDNNDTELER